VKGSVFIGIGGCYLRSLLEIFEDLLYLLGVCCLGNRSGINVV